MNFLVTNTPEGPARPSAGKGIYIRIHKKTGAGSHPNISAKLPQASLVAHFSIGLASSIKFPVGQVDILKTDQVGSLLSTGTSD